MKVIKSSVSTVLLGSMVFLAACSSTGSDTGTKPAGNNAAESGAEKKSVTITAAVQKHSAIDALQALLPEFEKETGIKVKFEVLPQEEQDAKVELTLASGSDQYDVFLLDHMYTPKYAKANWIEDLSPFIEKNKSTININDFMQGYVSALSYEGKVYALPLYGESTMLMYNKELFEKAGIAKAPTTFDELKEAAAKLTKDGHYGIVMRGQRGAGMNVYTWAGFYNAFGAKWLVDGKPAVNSDAAVQATQLYADLITKYGPPGGANFSWDQVQLAVQQGTVAMAIDATNFAARLENPENSKVVGKMGYAFVPKGPNGSSPSSATRGFAIPKTSKNKEAAFQFIQWALSEKIQTKTALEGLRADTTRVSVWNNEEYKKKFNFDNGNWIKVAVDSMNQADGEYRPRIPQWKQMGDGLGIAVSSVLSGVSAKEALDKAQKDIEKYFK
ncbi:ABC transporter substrate-binding protein [Paenibacillus elgii]|uniref:ABC transporter substrate-binding protein n=1 Tax=Paenibacillus elgii TaxID=189691 RepID=UPI00203CD3C7|nr:sugar ABC transporter substrate-binding protein [Paenibacillus elgii]MCM3270845.1 sugar ABC transporter substrate-binding protein [Paenibacillus elgii]